MRKGHWVAAAVLAAGLARASEFASYHTFKIDEIYSNPTGTVQYVELHELLHADGQNFFTEAPDIKSSTHDFMFPSNLPNGTTHDKFVLLGTAGYASIPGVPAPDFTIPASFFNPAGDTLQYGTTGPDGTVDLTTFGALPSDVTQSLNRTGTFGPGGNTYAVLTNTPTNFAGVTGSVPEPATALVAGIVTISFALRRRARAK